MESRTRAYALILLLALTGCAGRATEVTPPNEYEVALQELDTQLIKRCQGLGDLPDTAVGSLLQDFVNLSAVATPCRANHNALVDYLTPLIEKAKARKD